MFARLSGLACTTTALPSASMSSSTVRRAGWDSSHVVPLLPARRAGKSPAGGAGGGGGRDLEPCRPALARLQRRHVAGVEAVDDGGRVQVRAGGRERRLALADAVDMEAVEALGEPRERRADGELAAGPGEEPDA